MSGEHRRFGGWLLPVLVVGVGVWLLATGFLSGTLRPVTLKPVGWAGLALMAGGIVACFAARQNRLIKLLGVFVCGIGAILVICL